LKHTGRAGSSVRIITINLPYNSNQKLKTVLDRVNSDEYLQSLWDCININAVRRLGLSDHGRVHFAIVSNIGLKILRNLIEAGVEPSIVTDHKLTNDDAEVVVFLGSVLHDLGMVAHRENHQIFSVSLAAQIIPGLLTGIYGDRERAIVTAEALHTIYAHESEIPQFTIEAGVVRVADALDMKEGRARIPFTAGKKDIHALSAMSIRDVKIRKSKQKPVIVEISMYNESGIFQVDQLLKKKILGTKIEGFIEVVAQVENQQRKTVLTRYTLGATDSSPPKVSIE
jgi:metal-dependent HD superfamily phosphatase/phosphodiesterase